MNVRIFQGGAMECMCTQTRPRFILSSKTVLGGKESEPMLTPMETSPLLEKFSSEEDRTCDAASSSTASPTHNQRAIPAPSPDMNQHFFGGVLLVHSVIFSIFTDSPNEFSQPDHNSHDFDSVPSRLQTKEPPKSSYLPLQRSFCLA